MYLSLTVTFDPTYFTFVDASNGTSQTSTFSNTTSLLEWDLTDKIENGTSGYFWFDAIAASISDDTTLNFTVYAKDDSANAYINSTNVSVQIDAEAPEISYNTPTASYVRGTLVVNVTVKDRYIGTNTSTVQVYNETGAAWLTMTCTAITATTGYIDTYYCNYSNFDTSWVADGNNIQVRASDDYGHQRTVNSTSIVDNTAPSVGTATVNTTNYNSTGWVGTPIDIRATATDAVSGVDGATCEFYNGSAWVSASWDGTYCYFLNLNLTNGTQYTFNFRVNDVAGNQGTGTNLTVTADAYGPTTTDNETGGWHTADYYVYLDCSDTGVGCNQTFYNYSNGGWIQGSSVLINQEGNNTLAYYSTDGVGNTEGTHIIYTALDTVPPTTSDNAPSGWQNSAFTVTLTCNDATSGCNTTLYRVDSGAWQVGTSVSINTDGNHTINYYSNDTANNVETTKTTYAALDTSIPSVGLIVPLNNTRVSGTISFNISAGDGPSGVSTVYLQNGTGGNWVSMGLYEGDATNGNYSASIDTTQLADGWTNFTVNVTDNAGNFNDTILFHLYIDNTPPTIAISSPADNTYNNTGNISVDFTPTDAGAAAFGTNVTCNWSVYNSSGLVFNQAFSVPSNTAVQQVQPLSDAVYYWNITCDDGVGNTQTTTTRTYIVDQHPVNITDADATPDAFVCVISGHTTNNQVTFNVTAQDVGPAGIAWIKANISEINDTAPLVSLTNVGGNIWQATITVNDTSNDDFRGVNVTFTAQDNAGNGYYFWNSIDPHTQVVLFNMTTPPLRDPNCERAGPSTTVFCDELDFSNINFIQEVERNGSAACNDGHELPWGNTFNTVIKLNFTSLDFSDPAIGEKMQKLGEAIQPHITPPNEFGDSWIYVNTTAFNELNTTTTITMYGLPFASEPVITGPDSPINVVWVESTPYNINGIIVPNGNLTFTVGHFSQYNVTDNVAPIIDITAPPSITADNTPVVNVTVNGTGTKLSNITTYIDGQVLFSYNDTQIQQNCYNHTADWEVVHCNATSSQLSGGQHTVTVVAFDFGGQAPGNQNTSQKNFEVDTTPPTTTANVTNGMWYDSDVTVVLTCSDNGNCNSTAYRKDGGGAWTTGNTTTFNTEGNHTIEYNSTDTAGNVETTKTTTFYIDKTNPTATIYLTNNSNYTTSTVSVTVEPTDNLDDTLACSLYEGSTAVSGTTYITNNTNGTITSNSLSDGSHDLVAVCVDNAGNSGTSAQRTVNIAQAPTVTLSSPASGASTTDRTPTLTFTVSDNDASVTCTVYVDGSSVGTTTVSSGSSGSVTTGTLAVGTHNWYVTCTDAASHSTTSSTWSFRVRRLSSGGGGAGGGTIPVQEYTETFTVETTPETVQEVIETDENVQKALEEAGVDLTDEDTIQQIVETSAQVSQHFSVEMNVDHISPTASAVSVTITYEGDENLEDAIIIVPVPKSFASSASDITVDAPGATVIVTQSDPVFALVYDTLEAGAEKVVQFITNKRVNRETVKNELDEPTVLVKSIAAEEEQPQQPPAEEEKPAEEEQPQQPPAEQPQPPAEQPQPQPQPEQAGISTSMIAGIFVALAIVIILAYVLYTRRK